MRPIPATVAIAAALLAVLAATACGGSAPGPSAEASGKENEATSVLPAFTLKNLDGSDVRLADSNGTIRLVSFWATWCAPCREEIPVFNELQATYAGKGFTLLAISMDDGGAKVVKPFADENKIVYPVLLGADETAEAFGGIGGLPTTFLLDREGKIVESYFGAVPKRILVAKVEELLRGQG